MPILGCSRVRQHSLNFARTARIDVRQLPCHVGENLRNRALWASICQLPKRSGTHCAAMRRQVLLGCGCCCATCGFNLREMPWYKAYFASAMASGMAEYEASVSALKTELFGRLAEQNIQNILEVGVGTGPNLKYYANFGPDMKLVGLDPNREMQQYAEQNASIAGLAERFTFVEGFGDELPFQDASFDAVVITLVLCSVPDPGKVLAEVRRVLRPGQPLLLIEHVVARNAPGTRFLQAIFDPLQQLVADGCHLTRDTLRTVVDTGADTSMVRQLNVDKAYFIAPHIAGLVSWPQVATSSDGQQQQQA